VEVIALVLVEVSKVFNNNELPFKVKDTPEVPLIVTLFILAFHAVRSALVI
jgi:hypothetical protein